MRLSQRSTAVVLAARLCTRRSWQGKGGILVEVQHKRRDQFDHVLEVTKVDHLRVHIAIRNRDDGGQHALC